MPPTLTVLDRRWGWWKSVKVEDFFYKENESDESTLFLEYESSLAFFKKTMFK